MADKKYYILRLDSYDGDDSALFCRAGSHPFMYVVLVVQNGDAEIVDFGYESPEQLKEAWNDITFENA